LKKKKDKIEKILNDWIYDYFGYDDMIHHSMSLGFALGLGKIIIYSNRPGYLIGKAGCVIYDLEDRLKANHIHRKVYIKELAVGYFRNVNLSRLEELKRFIKRI